MKTCSKCGVEQDDSQFPKRHSRQCRSCIRAYYRLNYATNHEQREKRKAKYRDYHVAKSREYNKKHQMETRAYNRARALGLPAGYDQATVDLVAKMEQKPETPP